MNRSFEYITALEYRLKAATAELKAFKSGEKYTKLQAEHRKELYSLERQIRELKSELSRSHSEIITARNQWFEIFEELQRESDQRQAEFEKEKKQLMERLLKAECQRDDALDKVTEQRHKLYEAETECDPDEISTFENRYEDILQKAKEEYEYIPPNAYYKDGYNLYLRMKKYKSNHLLFLHDRRVPATNNEAERLLRSYIRKQVQAMSFRSQESIDYLCQCMSMLVMMRQKEEANIFDRVSRTFG